MKSTEQLALTQWMRGCVRGRTVHGCKKEQCRAHKRRRVLFRPLIENHDWRCCFFGTLSDTRVSALLDVSGEERLPQG
jgi:hypothetical protein